MATQWIMGHFLVSFFYRFKPMIQLICFLLCISPVTAKESKPTKLAFTFSLPPYLNHDLESGIEFDVIHAALLTQEITDLKIQNVHYLRAIDLIKAGRIDLIASNESNQLYSKEVSDMHTSDTTIYYVDCAISLANRNLDLKHTGNFNNKRIWAFKSASLSLGQDFQNMASTNPNYTEDFDQQKQVDMLAMGRIDIAISDRNIFSHKLHSRDELSESDFRFTEISSPTARVVRSTNQALIQQFNEGLASIRANGTYQKILDKYQKTYSQKCQ